MCNVGVTGKSSMPHSCHIEWIVEMGQIPMLMTCKYPHYVDYVRVKNAVH